MPHTRTQYRPQTDAGAPKLMPPRRYAVVLLNDDYTPMDFVVLVLTDIFRLPHTRAAAIMLLVHNEGRGVCGVFQKDIAESKCLQVQQCAAEAGYPLKCIVEPAA